MAKEHNYLQGFINQFQEELDPEEWDALLFLEWLDLNGYKIVKEERKCLDLHAADVGKEIVNVPPNK
jgi:hypothetical protein